MSRTNQQHFKLGIFVIAVLATFTLAIYSIGNQQNLFGASLRISSLFNNVNGLQKGNNVRYAGINVGSVEEIVILNDSTLRVDMVLDKKVQPFIKEDAIASIGSDGLVGNMIINISPGNGNRPAVVDDAILQSYTRIDPKDLLNTLGNTNENIALLSLNLLQIAENINRGGGTFATLLTDSSLATNLQQSVFTLRRSLQYFNSMGRHLDATIAEVRQGQGLLGYLLQDSTFFQQLEYFTYRLDSLLIGQTAPVLADLQQASTDLSATSATLRTLVEAINLNEGMMGTLTRDSSITKDLKETMHNLNQGTDRFNENMEALKHNFLFRKYFKKKEKEEKKKLKAEKSIDLVRSDHL